MAVGKGSLTRAAKAAVKTEPEAKEVKATAKKTEAVKEVKPAAKKTEAVKEVKPAAKKTEAVKEVKPAAKKAPAKKAPAKKSVVAAPSKEVVEKIIYQTSQGVLDRDAMVNEQFGIGDSMPVYFL